MTKKKGLSIGESLRGRMANMQAEATEENIEPAEQSIVAQPGEGAAMELLPPAKQGPPAAVSDPLESFNTRLRQSTQRRLKIYSALNDVKIQDVVNEALTAYLNSKEG